MNGRTLAVLAALICLALVALTACSKKCKPGEDAECWMGALLDTEKLDKAIDNLKQIGDKKAESALIEVFQAQTTKPQHREKIAEIFMKWKTRDAVKPMLAGLDYTVGPNKDGRKAKRTNRANQKIATALGVIGDQQAIQPVMRLVKSTKEPNVRRAAIRALGKLKATVAVDDLIKLVQDQNAMRIIRLNAVWALGEIGDPRAVPELVLALYREKAYFYSQADLALVKIGKPAVDPLVEAMFGRNAEAKKLNEQNVEVLAGALEANAAKVLGDIGESQAVEPLLKLVDKISKWEDETNQMLVMTRLITALGTIGDKRGMQVPLNYLDKEFWDVRLVCANALTSIGDRSAVTELLKFAAKGGDHPKTRVPLIEAIGNLGTEPALAELKKLQQTERDVDVTKALKESVKRLEAFVQCKANASCWIGKLDDKEASVREKAAYEIGQLQATQAVDALVKHLGDQSENVRFAVMWALERLKAKKAIEAIDELVAEEKGSTRYKVINYNYKLSAGRLSRM